MDNYSDPIPADEREAYNAYLDEIHNETIAEQGADLHAGCSWRNPFGMCNTCETQYADGLVDGERDYKHGVQVEDGYMRWQNKHGEIPRHSDGPIDGYCHGWQMAMLTILVHGSGAPFSVYGRRMGVA